MGFNDMEVMLAPQHRNRLSALSGIVLGVFDRPAFSRVLLPRLNRLREHLALAPFKKEGCLTPCC